MKIYPNTKIKQIAFELGFDFCGISKADFLESEAPKLEHWLSNNYNGKMAYMERYFDMRLDPRLLVSDAKSIISLAYNYFPSTENSNDIKISKYALGDDYHKVIQKKLKEFLYRIQELYGNFEGRGFVDSAPIMEKAWANQSGIGWTGKHTNLITKKWGSYFFLSELIITLPLETDNQGYKDYCGTCTKCIDACPTEAIFAPYQLDASKCISYLTIELKENIPQEFHSKMENWVFGCDICQEVCPWNRFSKPHKEESFMPKNNFSKKDWQDLKTETFEIIFKNSPLKRAGLQKIKNSIRFLEE